MNVLNFRTLDLNLLRVFDEVMAERNLTRAAHNLSMTQSAVSNALRRLRELIGDDLVRRSGYGVGVEAPLVTLRVLPLTTRDPPDMLEAGEVDLAIGHFPGVLAELNASHLQEHAPRFQTSRLYSTDYVVVMRRNHPLVSFSGRPWGFVDEALAAQSRSRRVVLTVNQFFTAGQVVATSDLLTVLPRHFVGMTGHGHALVQRAIPLEMPPVQVDMLWHRHTHTLGPQRWLRDLVLRAAKQDGAS